MSRRFFCSAAWALCWGSSSPASSPAEGRTPADIPVALLMISLFGLYLFGTSGGLAAGLPALGSFGLVGVDIMLLTRVLRRGAEEHRHRLGLVLDGVQTPAPRRRRAGDRAVWFYPTSGFGRRRFGGVLAALALVVLVSDRLWASQ